ncbi:LolA family protein [Profundibacterium mesophilum]|uniref:Outer membrane lipoprotein carrier protein n=1 Tax=Profundibacterium mesophilum KAUST100406-0324 TaxID=1037889 RepID=A0A921NWC3_9RHOB|nr:outer membrane lipoprotein carrier protein LolA [Profundibacterium mesophilum]KAF0676541.1 putative outer membrane lipoprotein carrier protein [Profundibacterium mesophilum KAUST100406-0324]
MNRRHFLATAGAAAIAAVIGGPAAAAPLSLSEISSYFNGLQTAQSDFTQINNDGTIATGTLVIQRPGRMRFDYNPPEETLVMAGGGQVAIFDARSNSKRPEQYPLSQTPLNLILERNVDLGRRGMVVGHRQDGAKTIVVAQDPERPENGKIDLVFTGNPVQLRQWVVTDGSGSQTTVILGDLRRTGTPPSRLFNITGEIQRRGG